MHVHEFKGKKDETSQNVKTLKKGKPRNKKKVQVLLTMLLLFQMDHWVTGFLYLDSLSPLAYTTFFGHFWHPVHCHIRRSFFCRHSILPVSIPLLTTFSVSRGTLPPYW